MDIFNLEKILSGEPTFRLKQAREAVFLNLIEDWDEAINLPPDLREKLNQEVPLKINAKVFELKDGAQKALITLADGVKIETVLMRHQNGRNTVCVSSQAGCALGCAFCATGRVGFKRNLTLDEIVEQVLFWARILKKENKRVGNIVFMGMGESFLNYDNVLSAIKILNDENGLNIGSRHISLSTAGIVEGIKKLADEPLQVNLALSLHAPNDALRQEIMPVAKKYKIAEIFEALEYYIKKTRRRVMLEYIMIKDLNDSPICAEELVALIKKMKQPLVFVNLILYNETGVFKPSSAERVKAFKAVLEKEKIAVTQRWRFGGDSAAACGQLAPHL